MNSKKFGTILNLLKKEYPKAEISLYFSNPFELLVATILSAQCTDKRVNIVTGSLFNKYKSLKDYTEANLAEFENDIRSTGFFRNKARNILQTAQKISNDFAGQVPDSMEKLLKLPGVARKTANVVLFNAFGKQEGIAVDTHVGRLSQRIGLSKKKDAQKIERDLMELLPKKEWGRFTYLLIEHGRKVCLAKKPKCLECVLQSLCPAKKNFFILK